MARTAEEILKAQCGELMFQVSLLQSEKERLREGVIELGRMVPPDALAKASDELKQLLGIPPGATMVSPPSKSGNDEAVEEVVEASRA